MPQSIRPRRRGIRLAGPRSYLAAALWAGWWTAGGCMRAPHDDGGATETASGEAAFGTRAPPAASRPQRDSLTDRAWSLVELDGRPAVTAPNGQRPYIRLRGDTARLEGFSGCNSVFGQYERSGSDRLRFARVGSTRRACVDSAPAGQEQRFMAALTATRRYTLHRDTLALFSDEALRARFTAPGR